MKLLIYLGAAAAAITVLGIGLTSTSQPLSATVAGFLGWAVSPYLGLMLLTRTARQKVSIITIAILTAAIAGFGIWIYVDSMFIHSDAQSALVFAVVPLWQWALILITVLLLFFNNLRNNFKRRKQ